MSKDYREAARKIAEENETLIFELYFEKNKNGDYVVSELAKRNKKIFDEGAYLFLKDEVRDVIKELDEWYTNRL